MSVSHFTARRRFRSAPLYYQIYLTPYMLTSAVVTYISCSATRRPVDGSDQNKKQKVDKNKQNRQKIKQILCVACKTHGDRLIIVEFV